MARSPHLDVVRPPMTRPLLLVEKWARHRGDRTSRGAGIFDSGRVEPIVQVHHGSARIFVRDLGKCLMILGVDEIASEARASLARSSEAERGQFLSDLREILMSCPRVGFALAPAQFRDAGEVERILLDQTIQIAENDPASFNRFCDAIQETETLLLRVAAYVERSLPTSARAAAYSSTTPPPTELYL